MYVVLECPPTSSFRVPHAPSQILVLFFDYYFWVTQWYLQISVLWLVSREKITGENYFFISQHQLVTYKSTSCDGSPWNFSHAPWHANWFYHYSDPGRLSYFGDFKGVNYRSCLGSTHYQHCIFLIGPLFHDVPWGLGLELALHMDHLELSTWLSHVLWMWNFIISFFVANRSFFDE